MTLERRNPYGGLDAERLRAFEATLPAPLPADYRTFLLDFNGATVDDPEPFAEVDGGTAVETLFGLHSGPNYFRLDEMRVNMHGLVAPSLLLIAADPYGNYFGLELEGRRRGAIYFVDHEQLSVATSLLTQVAESFTALLARIGADVVECPAPTSVEEALKRADADALRRLLEKRSGAGLVHAALRTRSLEVVRVVLERGGDANERGAIGGSETPLFVAAREDRVDVARLLLEHGADPNATCGAGGTALEMAAPWPAVFELLALAGATSTKDRLREAVLRITRGRRR